MHQELVHKSHSHKQTGPKGRSDGSAAHSMAVWNYSPMTVNDYSASPCRMQEKFTETFDFFENFC